MKDVGMSKPKKHANKVGRLTKDQKLNKPLRYNISVFVDQNFTINAIGMVLESV